MNAITTQQLKSDLRRVIDDTERVMQGIAHVADDNVDELKARASIQLNAARERLQDIEAKAAAGMKDAVRRGDSYVHEHPWSMAGYAVAGGFLLGWLARRH